MSTSMFETLLELPLFIGASVERMAQMVGAYKFNFAKYAPGETIISKGDKCEDLVFILSGSVRATLSQDDGGQYIVRQTFKAKSVLAPEYMFGRTPVFPMDIVAIDQVAMLRISKNDYVKILGRDQVFMLNYMNIISKIAQKNFTGIVNVEPGNPLHGLAYWVYMLTFDCSHDIVFGFNNHRLRYSTGLDDENAKILLEELQKDGVIEVSDSEFKILDRERLLKSLKFNPSSI